MTGTKRLKKTIKNAAAGNKKMTVEEAIKFYLKRGFTRFPVGYWIDGENIILNTKRLGENPYDPLIEPGQFIVEPNGNVTATNPIYTPAIAQKKMKRLHLLPLIFSLCFKKK